MGRTTPTYRNALERLESVWEPMRRGLRRQYQSDFDRLFARARGFADAAGYANPPEPERAMVFSLLLAHEVELRELRERLDAVERAHAREMEGESEGRACECTYGNESEGNREATPDRDEVE